MHILMLAAENDALPGGKVGGLGDVMRDLPQALACQGHRVTVLMPAYGRYHVLPEASWQSEVQVSFAGREERPALYRLDLPLQNPDVSIQVIEHELISAPGAGRIYVEDDSGPFAADATRFALFCAAVAELLLRGQFGEVDAVHAHDWHMGPFLFLRRYGERYRSLLDLRTVFSIHNLAYQGLRPFRGVASSLEGWFPGLSYSGDLITDTRHHDCVNLMRAGINLADVVSTVSPTYALEILRPGRMEGGEVGGEGLEQDLSRLHRDKRLVGILNGCDYSQPAAAPLELAQLWPLIEQQLDDWALSRPMPSHYFALKQLGALRRRRRKPAPLLVSIGRLTTQKLGLLVAEYGEASVMDALLERLDGGLLILLGSGDSALQDFFCECMRRHSNLLFLCGYSETLADTLFSSAELFLMPSIFEPCGISQMLAMRAGTPCLVHRTGGLSDTVQHGENGFSFGGDSLSDRLEDLLRVLESSLELYRQQPDQWQRLQAAAAASRFTWDDSVRQYLKLYQPR